MPVYERGIVVRDIARVHLTFDQAIQLAERVERNAALLRARGRGRGGNIPRAAAILSEVKQSYAQFNRELNGLAARTAPRATEAARAVFDHTRKRPNTGVTPHLRTLIRSAPLHGILPGNLATGAVGIGNHTYLDKAVDPLYPGKSYWRAQEYGLDQGFVGRRVRGYFFGAGYSGEPSRPGAAPSRTHPLFVPARQQMFNFGGRGPGKRGGFGASMLIENPIEPRRFLERGRDHAYTQWLREWAGIQADVSRRLAAILA